MHSLMRFPLAGNLAWHFSHWNGFVWLQRWAGSKRILRNEIDLFNIIIVTIIVVIHCHHK